MGEIELHGELAGVGVRVGAHAPVALGGQRREVRDERAARVPNLAALPPTAIAG